MSNLFVNTFNETRTCTFKGDLYEVRDNGAILRRKRQYGRHRKLDDFWTFGTKDNDSGYAKFGNQRVHRIVATAFHGAPPTNEHIVDHIDTNRMNNRPENLRWITKLENILLNKITLKRVIESYGSVDEFFANPTKPKHKPLPNQFDWMRTVSLSEAAESRRKLENWAKNSKSPSGCGLGEWLFEHRTRVEPPNLPEIIPSLTKGAAQVNWRTPSEFPLCPLPGRDRKLMDYYRALSFGAVFAANELGKSYIVDGCQDRHSDCLVVVCRIENNPINDWGITSIYLHEGDFIHENKNTFFTLVEAMEIYAAGTGEGFYPEKFDPDLGRHPALVSASE
ncbi:HNH endonuclease signature motif containing protein [Ruegeria arenilitoris]|uniref:HNH endonuclease signature motif containing protein n=1 Tax=Ruegeria arenilitoris TaxID=1173585 RepID=UPI0014806FCC|nr:HNH endonuclease signature motif containing protein [Ruegeria arenilitoris]